MPRFVLSWTKLFKRTFRTAQPASCFLPPTLSAAFGAENRASVVDATSPLLTGHYLTFAAA